jgi:hypothetical protein
LSAYGPITFIALTPLTTWAIDGSAVGLRPTVAITAALLSVSPSTRYRPLPSVAQSLGARAQLAGVLRCFATDGSSRSLVLIHLAHILNGMGGPVVLSAPAKLSQTWFAPQERVTATAVSTFSNMLGAAVGFLLIPWQVQRFGESGHADATLGTPVQCERDRLWWTRT